MKLRPEGESCIGTEPPRGSGVDYDNTTSWNPLPEEEDSGGTEAKAGAADKTQKTLPNLSISRDQTERLLDTFPVTEDELVHLHQSYCSFLRQQEGVTPPLASLLDHPGIEHADKLRVIEEEILPEANLILPCALKNTFVVGCIHQQDDDVKFWEFLEALLSLCGRRGSSGLLDILYDLAVYKSNSEPTARSLVDLLHRISEATCFLKACQDRSHKHSKAPPDSLIQSVSQKAQGNIGDDTIVSRLIWKEWIQTTTPQVHQILSTFAHYAFFGPSHPFRSATSPLPLPHVDDSVILKGHCNSLSVSLAMLSPEMAGSWKRLYSSDCDGFSFETFERALLSYSGSTLLLVRTATPNQEVFGYYTSCPWKTSDDWYGSDSYNSFLFTLSPVLQYFAPMGSSKPFYMRLHNAPVTRGGVFHGLGIGGINKDTSRVHITSTFEQCKAGAIDSVYQSGPLLADGNVFFDIDVLELWAIESSDEALKICLDNGKAAERLREERRIKAAQVDRKQFLDDFQSGIFENSLFQHREQARGRHSFCVDENGAGYFVAEKAPSSKSLLKE